MSEIAVVNEDGQVGTVTAAEAQAGFGDGSLRPASQEEFSSLKAYRAHKAKQEKYGGAADTALAAGAGALRGMTLGLSDPALVGATSLFSRDAGKDLKTTLDAYKEVNPVASFAGEVGGVVLPALLSGGSAAGAEAGVLAKTASTIGGGARAISAPMRALSATGGIAERGITSLLGRGTAAQIASKAGAGAVEGALFGATRELSNQLTEEAIGNPALNAEKIFATAGHDLVLGTLVGGGFGIGGALKERSAGALKSILTKDGETFAQRLDDLSGEMAWNSARGTQKMAENANKYAGGVENVGKIWRDNADDLIGKSFGKATHEDLMPLADGLKRKGSNALGELEESISSLAEKRGMSPKSAVEYLEKMKQDALAPLEGKIGMNADRQKIENFFDEALDKLGIRGVEKVKIEPPAPPAMGATGIASANDNAVAAINRDAATGRYLQTYKTVVKDRALQLKEIRAIRQDADALWTKNKLNPPEASVYKDIRRQLEKDFENRTEALSLSGEERSLFSQYKEAKKLYQAGEILEKAASRGAAAKVNNQFLSLTDKINASAGGIVGSAIGGLPGAMIGQGVAGIASKFVRSKFSFVASDLAQRASDKLANIAKVSLNADKVIEKKVHSLLSGSATPASKTAPVLVELFGTGKQQRQNVEASIDKVAAFSVADIHGKFGHVADYAPAHATALSAQYSKTMAYLQSKAPQPITTTFLLGGKKSYATTDLIRWSNTLKAASNPTIILTEAASGKVSLEQVETVRYLYPETFQQMQKHVSSFILGTAGKKPKANLKTQVSLAQIFGIVHPLTDPGLVAEMQRYTASTPANPSSVAPPPSRQIEPSSLVESLKTETQRLE